MPIYEYRCTVCDHRFEVRQNFDDPPNRRCPRCRASAQRIIHPVGVVFKGRGWYSTDHRSLGNSSGNGSKPPAGEDNSSETKAAEATPAPAAESKSDD